MKEYNGYQSNFLGRKVSLPKLSPAQQKDLAKVDGVKDKVAHYFNYSLQVCASRRLPYFTASNIDGACFVQAER